MAGTDGDALVPERVFGEGADADDDQFHEAPRLSTSGRRGPKEVAP
jgi:hypothetical protein